ncbi:MAG TPA: thioredoxin family protein [Polyangiaceae bacterium]|nr:thioredoxin family protein [Polyangiaceae bacterium]
MRSFFSARGTRAPAWGVVWLVTLGSGCSRKPAEPAEPTAAQRAPVSAPSTPSALGSARLGAPAPDFELADTEGQPVKLSSFRGKRVVIEWFNPGCPFVKASHTKGSLVNSAARQQANGVVWLAINSAAPGKQGSGAEVNREARATYNLQHPVLLDETGQVGRAYGAAHTPHMFVIDQNGILVYRGAIDNSPDGEGESPSGGKLVNYVEAALTDLGAGRAVSTPETEAYGCTVKYGS